MRFVSLIVVWLGFLLVSIPSYSSEVALDYVMGEGDVKGLRLGYRPAYFSISEYGFSEGSYIYFELSTNYWEYGDPKRSDTSFAIALSPVLNVPITKLGTMPVNFEFGIGMSYVSDTRFAGKDIGVHYQFEDRIGINLSVTPTSKVGMRYLHYSNAGLSDHNPGLDFFNLFYVRRF
ncbi:acyloxyacyl hydrolase [Pseudoalteromonas peptidolytica]|uniref:acyloxyacyl hydrolase n=1 Tax=Pseudoalteromonas peptidolytica TaxID=61150 RepID=UPI00298D8024|nr:acyloxyacyl hydrolase [Pseudoalteromonas peptidolytica]MDW7550141.1 acyloxyacyl hydrolase [Pseudoalteromonas peptidolytica]